MINKYFVFLFATGLFLSSGLLADDLTIQAIISGAEKKWEESQKNLHTQHHLAIIEEDLKKAKRFQTMVNTDGQYSRTFRGPDESIYSGHIRVVETIHLGNIAGGVLHGEVGGGLTFSDNDQNDLNPHANINYTIPLDADAMTFNSQNAKKDAVKKEHHIRMLAHKKAQTIKAVIQSYIQTLRAQVQNSILTGTRQTSDVTEPSTFSEIMRAQNELIRDIRIDESNDRLTESIIHLLELSGSDATNVSRVLNTPPMLPFDAIIHPDELDPDAALVAVLARFHVNNAEFKKYQAAHGQAPKLSIDALISDVAAFHPQASDFRLDDAHAQLRTHVSFPIFNNHIRDLNRQKSELLIQSAENAYEVRKKEWVSHMRSLYDSIEKTKKRYSIIQKKQRLLEEAVHVVDEADRPKIAAAITTLEMEELSEVKGSLFVLMSNYIIESKGLDEFFHLIFKGDNYEN